MKPSAPTRRLVLHTAHVLSKKRQVTTSDLMAHLQAFAEYLREMTGEPHLNVQVVMPKPPEDAAPAAAAPVPTSGAPAAATPA